MLVVFQPCVRQDPLWLSVVCNVSCFASLDVGQSWLLVCPLDGNHQMRRLPRSRRLRSGRESSHSASVKSVQIRWKENFRSIRGRGCMQGMSTSRRSPAARSASRGSGRYVIRRHRSADGTAAPSGKEGRDLPAQSARRQRAGRNNEGRCLIAA